MKDESVALIELFDQFNDDDKAREYLESIRWENGIVCPHCGCNEQAKFSTIKYNSKTKVRAGLRYCSNCKKQFTVTVGTIFADSHIPLRKWVIAWHLLCASKKGISSLQIMRMLKLGSYRTALFMMHRIRFALKQPVFNSKLYGTVEVDETYVGGKAKGAGGQWRKKKAAVVTLLQRGDHGEKRSVVIKDATPKNLRALVTEHVAPNATVYTDDNLGYHGLDANYNHGVVKHCIKEYGRYEDGKYVSTNQVEGSFSLLKRGIYGTFHHVSKKHLHLYVAEFDHRYNYRKSTDGERTIAGMKKANGKRLLYKSVVKKSGA